MPQRPQPPLRRRRARVGRTLSGAEQSANAARRPACAAASLWPVGFCCWRGARCCPRLGCDRPTRFVACALPVDVLVTDLSCTVTGTERVWGWPRTLRNAEHHGRERCRFFQSWFRSADDRRCVDVSRYDRVVNATRAVVPLRRFSGCCRPTQALPVALEAIVSGAARVGYCPASPAQ